MDESHLINEVVSLTAQPELELDDVAADTLEASAPGVYTGERFFQRRPDDYKKIVTLLANPDVSVRRIAKVFCVSQDTIRGIARREGLTISALRLRLRDACTNGALSLAERIADDPEAFPKSSLPVALDVLIRNALLLDGQATQITEHRETITIESFNAYLDRLSSADEIGLERENLSAMRPATGAALTPPLGVAAPVAAAAPARLVDRPVIEFAPGEVEERVSGCSPHDPPATEPRKSAD
jgi:hypothetical protein